MHVFICILRIYTLTHPYYVYEHCRPMLMRTQYCHTTLKSVIFKDARRNISAPLAMSTNVYKTIPNFQEKIEKKTMPGWMLGQDRPKESSSDVLMCKSKRRDSTVLLKYTPWQYSRFCYLLFYPSSPLRACAKPPAGVSLPRRGPPGRIPVHF